jgi:hypothetical protein
VTFLFLQKYSFLKLIFITSLIVLSSTILFGFVQSVMVTLNKEKLMSTYKAPLNPPKLQKKYDVIVLGGEPEGVAAAVAAARNGAKTLLIEHRPGLGGLMTFGMLNFLDIAQGTDGKSVNRGIFQEWHKLVGNDIAVDIKLAKASFLKLVLDEKNITLTLNTEIVSPILSDDGVTVTGVNLSNKNGEHIVKAERFIDATQDADFAAASGAPYYIGGEDIHLKDRLMAVTPVIHLKGVDWEGVKAAAKSKKFGKAEVTSTTAWGFNDLHHMYKAKEDNTRLRGLNLVRIPNATEGDEFFINALQIFGVNGLDPEAKREALDRGKREINNVLTYLRKNFPGFEEAELASYPTELYVRETRHIKAEYQLTMADVWTRRDHWDSIGFGGYPVDVQATSLKDWGYVISSPKQYAIPFRSLIPLKVENVLVTGRSAGYSSVAFGSTRVIPTGMTTGEAAGVAAAMSLGKKHTFRSLSKDQQWIKQLRSKLEKQGAYVKYFSLNYPYKGEWFDESIQFLINYALLVAGYNNDLYVQSDLKTLHFVNLLVNGTKRIDPETFKHMEDILRVIYDVPGVETSVFTRNQLAGYILYVYGNMNHKDMGDKDIWRLALEHSLIDRTIYDRIPEDRVLNRAEGYYIAAYLLNALVEKKAAN